MERLINIKNKHYPIRTCASCEFTYWGGWKGDKACPKCGFAHYGAAFMYGWLGSIVELITRKAYRRRNERI